MNVLHVQGVKHKVSRQVYVLGHAIQMNTILDQVVKHVPPNAFSVPGLIRSAIVHNAR